MGRRANASTIVITDIHRFDSFQAMLEVLGFEHFRPDDDSIDQALKTYRRYYSPSDEEKCGVTLLSFQLKK